MPWPIPTLRARPAAVPLRWRNWITIFIVIMVCGAALALYCWPHGKTDRQLELWLLAIGAPAVVFLAMLGARLTHYGQAKLRHDVWEKARLRVAGEWKQWTRKSKVVAKASVFLPPGLNVSVWLDENPRLPVNLDRCVSLGWSFSSTAEQWVTHLLGLVAERFVQDISTTKSPLEVQFLLDAQTYSELQVRVFDATSVFASLLKMAGVEIEVTVVTKMAVAIDHISDWMDKTRTNPVLLIAGQRSSIEDPALYSEGACALLFCPDDASVLSRGPAATGIFRPMVSNVKALKVDVAQLLFAQSTADLPIDVWHTGLDGNAKGDVLTALSIATGGLAANERDMRQNRFDEAAGIPGPVSSWIAMSLAILASPRRCRSQLIVSASTGKSMAICMVSELNVD